MKNILCLDRRSCILLGLVLALFFSLSNFCQSQGTEYFKCPSYEIPTPEENPEETNCQTCETNPNHPNFSCFSATIIGHGSSFPKSSDIGPSITGDVCMVGSFIVDEPFIFQNAVVRICKGATIYVQTSNPIIGPESGLVIDHSEFYSCEGLWKGIRVSNNSSCNTRNNSKIADAEIAIGTTYPISHLYIENTVFNRNRIGINISECVDQNQIPCPIPFSTGVIWTFRGNQFTCSSPLKGTLNEYSFAGVKMKSASIIDYPNSSFTRFSDLHYGILAEGRCNIGATKMIFHRIKRDGIYLESGTLKLIDSNFFSCGEKGINIGTGNLVDLKDVSLMLNGIGTVDMFGVSIGNTTLNAPINCNRLVVHGASLGPTPRTGIGISGISTGTKIRIDGASIFNIWGNHSSGVRLGSLAPSTTTEIWGNSFRSSSVGEILVSNPPSAAGISTFGNANNLSIKLNTFSGYAPPIAPFYITKDRGIDLGTNTTGTNNEITANDFNDEFLTLHDAIYVNGFQNMKYCSNTLTGARDESHGFNFNGTCLGTDLIGNIMTFGESPTPSLSSVALFIQGGTQIGAQDQKGNEWHNLSGTEPLFHAKCAAVPAFNKFIVHTPRSTCADENNPTCFFKYHPRKIDPDDPDEFFEMKNGSPVDGCTEGTSTDELDRIIAQGLFESPIEDPAMGWVLERYLYQKFEINPTLLSEHISFPLFMTNKENGSVGRFYEIQKSIENALLPSEGINAQSQQALTDIGLLMDSIKAVDEQLEMVTNGSELETLLQSKKGLMDQIEDQNSLYDSLSNIYQSELATLLQTAYALNEMVSTTYLYEANEKTVNQIYLLSMMQQGGELTLNQVIALQAIAQQDPKLAGPAVHTALGMLPECAKPEILQVYSISEGGETLQVSSESTDRNNRSLPSSKFSKIIVSPNPAESIFKVSGLEYGTGKLSVLDLQGRLLLSKVFTGNEVVMEIGTNIPTGIYLIKIAMDDGSTYVEKLAVHPN